MGQPRMIFHHPMPVDVDPKSGSSLRPTQMLRAFESLGYEVAVIAGSSAERSSAAAAVRRRIERGDVFEFAYSESTTAPNSITDERHVPHVRLDASILGGLRDAGIPVGLYYRDLHWRFPFYKASVSRPKWMVLRTLYEIEWRLYRRSVDHLFLQSLQMAEHLPTPWTSGNISALPPGCSPSFSDRPIGGDGSPRATTLRLLYVGGITPPLYDLTRVFEMTRESGHQLTICCRVEESERLPRDLITNPRVRIVHASGPHLAELYEWADLALNVYEPHPYRDFVLPIKLFESIGYGVPTVTDARTAAGEFVSAHGVGLVLREGAALLPALADLLDGEGELEALTRRVRSVSETETWLVRATQARDVLRGLDRRA